MKKIYSALLILSLFFALTSCSHNNGGNDAVWGTWKLDGLLVDGVADATYASNCFWKFQGDVVLVQLVDDALHISDDRYGTYTLTDDNSLLTLYFNHSSDQWQQGEAHYAPPAYIYITQPVTSFDVVKLSGKKMTVVLTTASATYTYHFTRW